MKFMKIFDRSTRRSILPGFGLSLGFSVLYLSLLVFLPLSAIFVSTLNMSWEQFWQTVTQERVVASYILSFGTSLAAALINLVFGFIVAWVIVRYSFPGKRWIDMLIDLPFALPTSVAGIALTTLYAHNGWFGRWLEKLDIHVAFTPLGIIVALTFIGLPFVVRTVQPVLQDLDSATEEAAVSLGASRTRVFWRIILPEMIPMLFTGFALAFARGVGEYGSVVFIAGNMPMRTEIAPLLIMTKLEQFDYMGATAIASVMLVISFALLMLTNYLQWRISKRLFIRR